MYFVACTTVCLRLGTTSGQFLCSFRTEILCACRYSYSIIARGKNKYISQKSVSLWILVPPHFQNCCFIVVGCSDILCSENTSTLKAFCPCHVVSLSVFISRFSHEFPSKSWPCLLFKVNTAIFQARLRDRVIMIKGLAIQSLLMYLPRKSVIYFAIKFSSNSLNIPHLG